MITLEYIKSRLDVIHDADDEKLQGILDAACDEAAVFLGVATLDELLDSDQTTLPKTVCEGVALLVSAGYEAQPDELELLQRAAWTKLQPYRTGMGV
jgi:hypothetical protein